jgi:hypothetical protein
MAGSTNAKSATKKMFKKTEKDGSNTIVPMTAKEGIDKIANMEGAITATIPLSMVQGQWLETLCATADFSNQNTAKAVVRLENYTVIMTIIPNHLMFDGSAFLATMNGMENTEED